MPTIQSSRREGYFDPAHDFVLNPRGYVSPDELRFWNELSEMSYEEKRSRYYTVYKALKEAGVDVSDLPSPDDFHPQMQYSGGATSIPVPGFPDVLPLPGATPPPGAAEVAARARADNERKLDMALHDLEAKEHEEPAGNEPAQPQGPLAETGAGRANILQKILEKLAAATLTDRVQFGTNMRGVDVSRILKGNDALRNSIVKILNDNGISVPKGRYNTTGNANIIVDKILKMDGTVKDVLRAALRKAFFDHAKNITEEQRESMFGPLPGMDEPVKPPEQVLPPSIPNELFRNLQDSMVLTFGMGDADAQDFVKELLHRYDAIGFELGAQGGDIRDGLEKGRNQFVEKLLSIIEENDKQLRMAGSRGVGRGAIAPDTDKLVDSIERIFGDVLAGTPGVNKVPQAARDKFTKWLSDRLLGKFRTRPRGTPVPSATDDGTGIGLPKDASGLDPGLFGGNLQKPNRAESSTSANAGPDPPPYSRPAYLDRILQGMTEDGKEHKVGHIRDDYRAPVDMSRRDDADRIDHAIIALENGTPGALRDVATLLARPGANIRIHRVQFGGGGGGGPPDDDPYYTITSGTHRFRIRHNKLVALIVALTSMGALVVEESIRKAAEDEQSKEDQSDNTDDQGDGDSGGASPDDTDDQDPNKRTQPHPGANPPDAPPGTGPTGHPGAGGHPAGPRLDPALVRERDRARQYLKALLQHPDATVSQIRDAQLRLDELNATIRKNDPGVKTVTIPAVETDDADTVAKYIGDLDDSEEAGDALERAEFEVGGQGRVLLSKPAERREEQRLWNEFDYVKPGYGEGARNPLYLHDKAHDRMRFGPLSAPKRTHKPCPEPPRKPGWQPRFVPVYQFDNQLDDEYNNSVFGWTPELQNSVRERDWENDMSGYHPDHCLRRYKAQPVRIQQFRTDGLNFAPENYLHKPQGGGFGGAPSERVPYDNCWGFAQTKNLDCVEYKLARKRL